MRRTAVHRSSGLLHSLTLLRIFLVASAVILAGGAITLSSTISGDLRESALEDNARDLSVYVDAVLAPNLVHGNRVAAKPEPLRRLARTVRLPADVRGIEVFRRDGRLVFSTMRPERVGRRHSSPELIATIGSGKPSATLVDPSGKAPPVVRAWSPLSSGKRVVGGVTATLPGSVVEDAIAGTRRTIWLAVAVVFGILWLALAVLVRGASGRLQRQNEDLQWRSRELSETARELEATLLETIETLNAAVEARDPYTAGHSQRVRRVSLAIGRELNLTPKQLGALGTASLFHDVGKIGMPDSILTKPEALAPAEAAIMRDHVTRGVEIVARITSLADAVPIIRHHHERWDGLGYPDGLSGEEIPVEAAIIAIADAWDAMTTDRPYAAALDVNKAMLQIRAGREKQFNPTVVDAFLTVAKRKPAEILPPESATALLAVV